MLIYTFRFMSTGEPKPLLGMSAAQLDLIETTFRLGMAHPVAGYPDRAPAFLEQVAIARAAIPYL